MESDSPQSVLHQVLETSRHSQECFARAASATTDAHLRKVLGEYSEQRAQFALQIESLLRQLGTPRPQAPAIQHRTWTQLQEPIAGGNEAILQSCTRAEETAIETYRAALMHDLPEGGRELLESQSRQVDEVHIRMAELRAHLQVNPAISKL
jgi:uncharacterized protein (TIGR02284 family)